MQSALRRRVKNAVLSALLEIPAEFPFFDVEPSAPTTSVTITAIWVRILNFSLIYQVNLSREIENACEGALALKHEKDIGR
jgi:hypothetical protein